VSQEAWAGWLAEAPRAVLPSAIVLLGLVASNIAHSRGLPHYRSRKVGHLLAGVAIVLSPVLFTSAFWPLVLSGGFTLLLLATHHWEVFHGVDRRGRMSAPLFPLAVFIGFGALWWFDPWVAIVPGLMLAFADAFTGIVRWRFERREVKGWSGTLACFVVCLAITIPLVPSFWVALATSVLGTAAERFCGDAPGSIIPLDDNIAMPLTATLTLLGGLYGSRLL